MRDEFWEQGIKFTRAPALGKAMWRGEHMGAMISLSRHGPPDRWTIAVDGVLVPHPFGQHYFTTRWNAVWVARDHVALEMVA